MSSEQRAEGSSIGRKLVGVGILLVSGYVLLKWALHLAAKFVWLAVVLLAIVGLIWGMFALRR